MLYILIDDSLICFLLGSTSEALANPIHNFNSKTLTEETTFSDPATTIIIENKIQ